MHPTAIGLRSPLFLRSPCSCAPYRKGQRAVGRCPFVRWLTNLVRLVRREMLASPAEIDMQSFKCCGLSPSGPALEPWGKEEISACISGFD